MKNWKTRVAASVVLIAATLTLAGVFAKPLLAQVRAALVRDVDNPALAPFTAGVTLAPPSNTLDGEQLITTVPAGKRLVVEHVSYSFGSAVGNQMIFGSLRQGHFGPSVLYLEVNPPHISAASSFTVQDGSQPVKAYFEAGDEVWVYLSTNSGASKILSLRVTGYLVTP